MLGSDGRLAETEWGTQDRPSEDPEAATRAYGEIAGMTVNQARKRITVAADYTRDEQLGKAVIRLDDLYAKSIAAQDTRTALQAQRELNRLLSLYADARRLFAAGRVHGRNADQLAGLGSLAAECV